MQNNNNKVIYSQAHANTVHHLYISDGIEAPLEYTDMLQVIRTAGPNDVVNLYMNSPGGHVSTAAQFRAALLSCEATTIAHLEGWCHSACPLIALSCDDIVVHEHSLLMIHVYTGGGYGKAPDMLHQVQEEHKWVCSLMEQAFKDFLTEEELEQMFNGTNFWFHSDEIVERWKRVIEVREKEMEEYKEEIREKIRESSSK